MPLSKYQKPPQAPPVFTATARSILAEAKALTEKTKTAYDQVVADVSRGKATFANTLHPILVDDNQSLAPRRILTFYQHVSVDKSLREASTEAEKLLDNFNIEIKMREDMFQLVDAAFTSRKSQELDREALHLLQKEHQKYVRNGLLLPAGSQRDRFKEIQKRLSQLCIQCQKNLKEESGGVWLYPEELEGVPSDDIDMSGLEKGTGENEGKVKLTFKYNHYIPLVKYTVHEGTRRAFVIAESNKSNINVPLFHEIIELQDKAACMLGYADHASLRIEQKMAKTPANVNSFLGDLRKRLAPGGAAEAERLLAYKRRDQEERKGRAW